MADKTSLLITTTDTHGKQSTKTITNVNSEASTSNLLTFAQGLVDLSDNTYDSAALVERTELVDVPYNKRPWAPLTVSVVNGNKTFNLPQDVITEGMIAREGYIDLYIDDAGVTHDTTNGVYRAQLKLDTSKCGGAYIIFSVPYTTTTYDSGITKLEYVLNEHTAAGNYATATIEHHDDENNWHPYEDEMVCNEVSCLAIHPTDKYCSWILWIFMNKRGE